MSDSNFTLSEEDIKKILSTPVIEIPESNIPNNIHLSKENRIKQARKILKQRSKLDDYYEPPSGVIAVPPPKDAPRYNYAEMFKYCDKVDKKPKELSVEERKQFEVSKEEERIFNEELIKQAMQSPTEESIELNQKAFDLLNKLKG